MTVVSAIQKICDPYSIVVYLHFFVPPTNLRVKALALGGVLEPCTVLPGAMDMALSALAVGA